MIVCRCGGGGGLGLAVDLLEQGVRVRGFVGDEVVHLDELGFVHGEFEVEDIALAGEEGDAAGFGLVEVGVDAEHDLLVERQHLGLVLRDVGLQFARDLAGEVADDLVHQFAHDVADFVGGVGGGEVFLGHAHVQHVAFVQFHGGLGGEVDDHEAGETAVEEHEAADVRFQAGLADALHHAGVVDLALRGDG